MTRVRTRQGGSSVAHVPHALHATDRIWPETNCYVDVWIELLHAQQLVPEACLGCTLAVDFQGDQWTFFKPPLSELRSLYGIDVQELTLWRPLLAHALEHLGAGHWISVEADAWFLPDTSATDYRRAHTKTTIVLDDVDTAARRLGYFHNAGYHWLEGDDYAGLFEPGDGGPVALAPYAELIRVDRLVRRPPGELRARSRELVAGHLTYRDDRAIERFRDRFEVDLAELRTAGIEHFHRWAFAGIRQLGAAGELGAAYLCWLHEGAPPQPAGAALLRLAQEARTLQMKTARAVHAGRAVDPRAWFESISAAWQEAGEALAAGVR